MANAEPEFPKSVKIRVKLYFERFAFENYKRQLVDLPLLERERGVPVELLTAGQAAAELGRGRRTIGRRILAARRQASAVANAA
jgi:hypothetical protein